MEWKLAGIPVSIVLGVALGFIVGIVLLRLFRRFDPRATKRVLIVLGLSVLLVRVEDLLEAWVLFVVLLAVAVLSIILTAPLGAWAIAVTGNRVLEVAECDDHTSQPVT